MRTFKEYIELADESAEAARVDAKRKCYTAATTHAQVSRAWSQIAGLMAAHAMYEHSGKVLLGLGKSEKE